MFGRILKLLHYLGLIGFLGGLAASRVLSDFAEQAPPGALATLRVSIAGLGDALVIPALVLLVVTGMLLLVARPTLVHARWVWAKAVLTVGIAGTALAIVVPATRRAAAFAGEAALGTPAPAAMLEAAAAERNGAVIVVVLVLLALVLAVWRPRLGQPRDAAPGPER